MPTTAQHAKTQHATPKEVMYSPLSHNQP